MSRLQCENKDPHPGCDLETDRLRGDNHRRLVGAFDHTIGYTAEIKMRLTSAAGNNDYVDIFIFNQLFDDEFDYA